MIDIDVITSEEVEDILPVNPQHIHDYTVFICESFGFADGFVNIVFIGDDRMIDLNEKFRKRDGTTDVLSFDLSDEDSGNIEGEVYVSLERAKKQSSELNMPYEEEVARLVTHGLLHLTGSVHDTPVAYKTMAEDTEKMLKHYLKIAAEE